ncbi:DUF6691 family protein [Aquabacterium sp.]
MTRARAPALAPAARVRPGALMVPLVAGLLFGLGLFLSGMSNPLTVLAFLDVAGSWDPSLAWVMGGAVGVTLPLFAVILRRSTPWCDTQFHLPQKKSVDQRLILGAVLFGIGWGLSGYCPGPALVGLLAGNTETWVVAPAMLAGAWLQRVTSARQ